MLLHLHRLPWPKVLSCYRCGNITCMCHAFLLISFRQIKVFPQKKAVTKGSLKFEGNPTSEDQTAICSHLCFLNQRRACSDAEFSRTSTAAVSLQIRGLKGNFHNDSPLSPRSRSTGNKKQLATSLVTSICCYFHK